MDLVPRLDRSREPWHAVFPGLGDVRVAADGDVEVTVAPDATASDAERTARHDALVHGWARPLAEVRRGRALLYGAVVTPPAAPRTDAGAQATPTTVVDPADGAHLPVGLLLHGTVHDIAVALVGLAGRGWAVLGDHLTPAVWHEGLGTYVAEPSGAPVLVSRRRAEKAGLGGVSVRDDTDVVRIDVARASGPHAVAAVAVVARRRVDRPTLTVMSGLERFDTLGGVVVRGVLDTEPDLAPAQDMARRTRFARVPVAALNLMWRTIDDDLDEFIAWWHSSVSASASPDGVIA